MNSQLRRINIKRTWPELLLGLIFLFFISGVSYAQNPEQKFPDYYPEKFNAVGNIDRIAEDEIVIGDTLYRLSPSATYHTPSIRDASKVLFPVGSLVGFITNSEQVVTSLWLIE
jgi:hypothetical protein